MPEISWELPWGPEGILQLRDSQDAQVQTMEETVTHIARLTTKVTVPSRSLTAVTVQMMLPPCKNKMLGLILPLYWKGHCRNQIMLSTP